MSTASELVQRWLDAARGDLMAARNCVDGPNYLPGIPAPPSRDDLIGWMAEIEIAVRAAVAETGPD